MSRFPAILNPTEEDIQLLLSAQCHIGSKNVTKSMEQYVYKRRSDGVNLINLGKTWEKLILAARVIAAIENPHDVLVISARTFGHRAALKFAKYIGAEAIVGRFTPGTFTNYITRSFREPRIIICTDPLSDFQAIKESSYVNIPVISLADTDALLKYVDVAIPTNNKGKYALGLMYWMLARAVLRLRGALDYTTPWDVMVDMFFYRDAEELEKEAEAETAPEEAVDGAEVDNRIWGVPEGIDGGVSTTVDWAGEASNTDWADQTAAQSSWDN